MAEENDLIKQALRTLERITLRLKIALDTEGKFAPRGQRTTAYAALQGRVEYLRKLQAKANERYLRRKKKFE